MTTFDKRKDAYESKFAHDDALRFQAIARRNKLLGHWVAAKLGKVGADAEDYARSIVRADLQEVGDDDVLRKVRADLEAGGQPVDEAQLRATMIELMARAIADIEAQS